MDYRPEPGIAVEISPGIRRVLAPNPSPMTSWGTNTYLVGTDTLAVIDPGPDVPAHHEALRAAIGGATVEAVLVSHAHRDHSALSRRLASATDAPVLAYGPPEAGRSAVMNRLAANGRAGGGEGVDAGFLPDRRLSSGETFRIGGVSIEAIHTPGHFPGHLSFAAGDTLFSGDHVMGWSTTLISPPEGDVAAFMASCAALSLRSERVFLPGHGAPVRDPRARLDALVAHRQAREAQILDALGHEASTADALAALIYTDLAPALLPAAARNVLAHLVDLTERKAVSPVGEIGWNAPFRRL